tara:strand:- start:766 stop:1890 length:1125 start_codon:yes stop_codon:yes gene_type:complete
MRVLRLTTVLLVFFGCRATWAQDLQQVQVSVKVIEFQTNKDIETGLSAYFQQKLVPQPYGRAASPVGSISASDITFPGSTNAGITVFLDRLVTKYGDIEVVLQGLVDQGRAFILSQPTALVPVGAAADAKPTVVQTTQQIPYEDTVVVGSTAIQITNFRDTGVTLSILAPEIIDDDGNPETKEDTYINLQLTASVAEEGQRITVALDHLLAGTGGVFESSTNAIQVPEFITRVITTDVWVRHGQVLMLGGLYRNTENKDLSTLPWLTQSDRFMNGLIQRVLPFGVQPVPLSSSIGNSKLSHGRRELIFLIKADVPTLIYNEGITAKEEGSMLSNPAGVVTDVLNTLGNIPRELGEGVIGTDLDDGITTDLGAEE